MIYTYHLTMGTSWSEEANGSSQQQTQPPLIPSRPEVAIIPKTTNSININNNNINKGKQEKDLIKLPHNYEAIIKDFDSSIDKYSPEKIYEQLHAGIFLNGKKKKYWVVKENINCFMVFASGLSVTWGEDKNYWQWHDVETSEGKITIAELRNVCWLEVHGRFPTANLSPGIIYEVAYLIKIEYSSYGWEVPVNFRLTLPNGSKQEHKENLKEKQPKGEWIRIRVGEFKACQENLGEIEFSLYEYEGGNWKKGLVIKGVTIEPKSM